ncbi:19494_t:CDS:2 [Dentiscutata erythropus]|uniref:19494_t:CDS:1 n=1 Tax=Dentiscutata erythropus TaxID=1348616 RepID=A0A9N9P5X3_9GLOM|nr:19494_t:CDS:2 [Dentiscutata erythropus]
MPQTEEEIFQEFKSAADQYNEDSYHLKDLWYSDGTIQEIRTAKHQIKIAPKHPHFHNVVVSFQAALDAFLTLLTDWTLPFTHPLNWLYLIFVYPIVLFSFAIFELSLIIIHTVHLDALVKFIDEKWREYLTPGSYHFADNHKLSVNKLFYKNQANVIVGVDSDFYNQPQNGFIAEDGVDALDQPYFKEDEEIVEKHPDFNLDIAQFLLYMSDLVYSRESDKALSAKLNVYRFKKAPEKRDELIQEIVGLLRESDDTIRNQAKKWHLTFTSLTELNSCGDSFAGLFYSEKHNFIVVAFKGPTSDDFEKWFTDLVFQHEDGRSFIRNEVHKSYRSLLYPENKTGPYATIIDGIHHAIKNIRHYRDQGTRKHKLINIWVTGHSLGGAMATWFYGRVKKSPSDLGEHCVLRDAYVFGAPRVGDSDFVLTYKSSLGRHEKNVESALWRVVDDNDLLAHLPPGYRYPKNVGKYNILTNYSVGEAVKFYQDGRKPKLLKNPILEPGYVPVIKSSRPLDGDKYTVPTHEYDKSLPSFIRNHMTSRYALALAQARNHLSERGGSGTKGFNGEIILEREK